jgi:hypothetical protein
MIVRRFTTKGGGMRRPIEEDLPPMRLDVDLFKSEEPAMGQTTEEGELFATVLQAELYAIDMRRVGARFGPQVILSESAMLPGQNRDTNLTPEKAAEEQARFDKEIRGQALSRNLVGLSLSGGGIRSATFNLGVIQALARLRILRRFDYLSTVSGGGYIGGWLAAWLRREGEAPAPNEPTLVAAPPTDAFENVELQLDVSRLEQSRAARPVHKDHPIVDEEPEAIQHLRSYSNYLTPRPGLFTADTWTILAIYLRNFLLNQLMLLPIAVASVLAIWLLVLLYAPSPRPRLNRGLGTIEGGLFIGLLLFGFFLIALELSKLYRQRSSKRQPPPEGTRRLLDHPFFAWVARPMSPLRFLWLTVWPLMCCAVLCCWLFGIVVVKSVQPEGKEQWKAIRLNWSSFDRIHIFDGLPLVGGITFDAATAYNDWDDGDFPWDGAVPFVLAFGLLHLLAHMAALLSALIFDLVSRNLGSVEEVKGRLARDTCLSLASFVSGCIGGFLLYIVMVTVLWPLHHQPYAVATVGPPLMVMLFIFAAYSEVGLLGGFLHEDEREWWARVTAFLMIHAGSWFVIFGSAIYVPYLVQLLNKAISPMVTPGLVLGWLATAIGGAVAGRSPATGGKVKNQAFELLAKIGPTVFLIGLFAAVSWLVQVWIVNIDPYKDFLQEVGHVFSERVTPKGGIGPDELAYWLVGSLAIGGLMTFFLNVNLFSLHAMYANRLIRCYLGASRRKEEWLQRWTNGVWHPGRGGAPTGSQGPFRRGQLLTGFDAKDDISLRDLRIGPREGTDTGYWGPLRLINTALNLVAGKELAWQDRKAESFTLTPLYCGSKSTGYRKLTESADELMTLGRATAISGAAADPNMGYHQSAPVTALMTIFNTRLGWWLQNPRRPDWKAKSPSFGGLIWHELFGQTDENGKFVHLSDGGHFENLGVYELIRRRCRYIIACDAGQDRDSAYEDLANLSRLCRTDFGVRIEIDTSPIRWQGDQRFGRWHCAIGQIHYEDVDPHEMPGLIIYLKASMTGDEPADVQNYATMNPDFPHQTTADQFFDERQFESYRALGYHIAHSVFAASVRDAGVGPVPRVAPPSQDFAKLAETARAAFERENKRLFSKIRSRWFPAPPDIEATYEETAKAFNVMQGVLRSDPNLRGSSRDLYPELLRQLGNGKPAPAHKPPSRPVDGGVNPLPEPIGDGRGNAARNPRPLNGADGAGRVPDRIARRTAELHAANQMIQVIEYAWLGVRMEGYPEHPINRGWMNVLRRCAHSALLHRYWPALRGGFHQEFVRFFERELHLPDGSPAAFPLGLDGSEIVMDGTSRKPVTRTLKHLGREFAREWPGLPALPALVKAAINGPLPGCNHKAWLICTTRLGKPAYACGVVLAWDAQALDWKSLGANANPLRNDTQEDEVELFIWLRGPYRNVQIGRTCFENGTPQKESPLEDLLKKLPAKTSLCTSYPAHGSAGGDIEKKTWLNFFYHYEFRGSGQKDIEEGQVLLLKRPVGPRPAWRPGGAGAVPTPVNEPPERVVV